MRKSIGSFFSCLKSLKGGGADDLTCRNEAEYQWTVNDNHEKETIYGKEKKYQGLWAERL